MAALSADLDMDVVTISVPNNTVWWYENNGTTTPSFTQRQLAPSAGNGTSLTFTDVDAGAQCVAFTL